MGKAIVWQLCGTWKYLSDTYICKIILKIVSASAERAEANVELSLGGVFPF